MPRPVPSTNQLSPHPEYESLAPPSVTEGTTRHMDPCSEETKRDQLSMVISFPLLPLLYWRRNSNDSVRN